MELKDRHYYEVERITAITKKPYRDIVIWDEYLQSFIGGMGETVKIGPYCKVIKEVK